MSARVPNPRVLLDPDLRLFLWPPNGPDDTVTAIVIASPRLRPRWMSRAGDDRGRRYEVAALLELDGVLDEASVIIGDDGWELRPARFDGFEIDTRRLIPDSMRREAGRQVEALAKPVLRSLNGRA
jgi:hypothetical protein